MALRHGLRLFSIAHPAHGPHDTFVRNTAAAGATTKQKRYDSCVRAIPTEVLKNAARLFWDVDVTAIDPEKHEDFIVGRVLVEGDWECVRALQRELGDAALAAFVRRAGQRRLDRRTRRFFETVLDLPVEPCETTSSTNASAPLFVP